MENSHEIRRSRQSRIKDKYTLNPNFIVRELGGEFIAIQKDEQQAQADRVVFLNERCVFLWVKLEEHCSLIEMVEALMNKFDGIDEDEAQADVGEFIGKLKHAGMLLND